jgi:hypothetical protein
LYSAGHGGDRSVPGKQHLTLSLSPPCGYTADGQHGRRHRRRDNRQPNREQALMNKLAGSIAAATLVSFCLPAMAAGSDEQWEITTKMEMPGMAMPGTTMSTCLTKGTGYSGKPDKHCQVTDLQTSGNRTTWKMHCSGKDEMSGSGETTRTATTMNGTMHITSQGMQMTQTFSGKLVGSCDAAAERAKLDSRIEAAQKPARSVSPPAGSAKTAPPPSPAASGSQDDAATQAAEAAKKLKGMLGF